MLPKGGNDCFEQHGRGGARRSTKYFRAMEFEWSAFRSSIKVSDLLDVLTLPINWGGAHLGGQGLSFRKTSRKHWRNGGLRVGQRYSASLRIPMDQMCKPFSKFLFA
jgi:hypothetical protein